MKILNLKDKEIEVNGKLLFKIKNASLNSDDIIGVIGKNGSGKTTILKYIYEELTRNKITKKFLSFNEENKLKSGGENVVDIILNGLFENDEVFLLDEPTTYLDKANSMKISNLIKRTPATFCIATHDRKFLNEVCTKLWIIDQNELIEFKGNYAEYKTQQEIRSNEYSTELQKYNKETKKLKHSIQEMKEEQGRKSGKPKNMSASDYRIMGVKTKITQNQKKLQKKILKQEDKLSTYKKPKKIEEDYDIAFLDIFKIGNKRKFYIEEKGMTVNNKLLWTCSTMIFSSGDKVVVTGKNASGKTTLLNYIKSQIPKFYKVAYFEQNNLSLFDTDISLFQFIKNFTKISDIELKNILALLNFRGEDLNKKVNILSNGEKVKLYFISLLFQETDVLILDELTNFLDVVTIEAVENILKKYPGILIAVSHDESFVSNIATKIINVTSKKVLNFE